MLGVTETLLPPGAPEPEPLAVVRDRGGDIWVRAGGLDVTPWTGLTGETAGSHATWADLGCVGPLYEIERTRDQYEPWSPPGETVLEAAEPSDFEVRESALDAAVRLLLPADYADDVDEAVAATTGRVLAVAREFEAYLRGEHVDDAGAARRLLAEFVDCWTRYYVAPDPATTEAEERAMRAHLSAIHQNAEKLLAADGGA